MFSVSLYALVSVIIVSLVSLFGVFTLSLREQLLKKYIFLLVSLAVGALLGDAFIHLIPKAFEIIPNATHLSIAIIAGILIFFILEKVLHWHHHHTETEGKGCIHPMGCILIHSGYTTAKALRLNFLSALIAVLGTIIALVVGGKSEVLTSWLIPLAAGGFIYIAMSDLIPEMHKTKRLRDSVLQLITVVIGVLAMVLLLAVE